MEAYLASWLNLLGRWLHVIAGIAWIGSSFFFVWLDNHLRPGNDPDEEAKGIGGEVWSVHGGGFYHLRKYRIAPDTLPDPLHWFKWEAYTTWLSGVFLLGLMYWYGAEVYLIDPGVAALSKPVAVAAGIGVLVFGWVIYDLLCKSPLARNDKALGAAVFALTVVAAWGLCQVFSGRGAYIHYGAMLGTIMAANVFFVIIPGQRELVAATKEGRTPDPSHGIEGKRRSVHNTYFTLPVLFVMISNHFALSHGHRYNWLILVALSIAGALIRVYFVARHKGSPSPLPLVAAGLVLAGVAAAIAPRGAPRAGQQAVSFAHVLGVVQTRCTSCHATTPTQAGFTSPPAGIVLETGDQILAAAAQIHQQTVVTQAMPIGNLTKITPAEREAIARWYADGASRE